MPSDWRINPALLPVIGSAAAAIAAVLPSGGSHAPAPPVHQKQADDQATRLIRTNTRTTAQLVADLRPAVSARSSDAPSLPETYVVKRGDTLSEIAQTQFGNASEWPALWWENRKLVPDPDDVSAGQALSVWRWHPERAWLTAAADRALPHLVTPPDHPQTASQPQSAPASQPAQDDSPGTVSTGGMGSFQACVITRESGGNPNVMNSTGHYGLYQFSASTWADHGGNPADFGHASVAEQNQVFYNTVAVDGGSDWSPYDGCPF